MKMNTIDINCDMGEGIGNEAELFPYISSANIACGYHAGDEKTIREVMRMATHYQVSIGAHPSYDDRANFGRVSQQLPPHEIYQLVTAQLKLFYTIAEEEGVQIAHVKPHGALYNISAKEAGTASAIAQAVKDFDPNLALFGLSGSCSIAEARVLGLYTVSEAFADRTYQEDGSLTPRSLSGAQLETEASVARQVLQMVLDEKVRSVTGKIIPMEADTICIHGDGLHAVTFAKHIFEVLQQNNIAVKARSNQ